MRVKLFRAMWIASLASNIGTVMHTVGASWAMTSLTTSPAVVSLAQAAWTVPGFLFAIPAGALTDIVDRRSLITITQLVGMVIAAAMGVLQVMGHLGVGPLLLGTFLLSVALTLSGPAWTAMLPDMVGPDDLPQAIGLNSVSYNGPQSLGPAIGGLLVAAAGAQAVFFVNAVSFLGIVWVAHSYQRGQRVRPSDERLMEAMSTGIRYIRGNRAVHRFALRIVLAFLVTSALTALLPVVARQRLHVDAGRFGLVSTAVGVGAVLSIWALPRVRVRLGDDNAVFAAGVCWALGALTLSATENLVVALVALVVAGAGQMATMNVVFGLYMATLPDHVRGRAGSVVMLTVWLGASAGAVCWGWLASSASIATALAVAAAAQ
jgi:MFS family permease